MLFFQHVIVVVSLKSVSLTPNCTREQDTEVTASIAARTPTDLIARCAATSFTVTWKIPASVFHAIATLTVGDYCCCMTVYIVLLMFHRLIKFCPSRIYLD